MATNTKKANAASTIATTPAPSKTKSIIDIWVIWWKYTGSLNLGDYHVNDSDKDLDDLIDSIAGLLRRGAYETR